MKILASKMSEWSEICNKNNDPYGACVVKFADKWAIAMEGEIKAGNKLEDIAGDLSFKVAKEFGLSGFQYGCAVSILAQVWEHGEQLRRWHNLDNQIKDEGEKANETGGTLNPALLSVRTVGDS